MPRRPDPTFLLDEGVCGPDIVAPLRTVDGWIIERHLDHLESGVVDDSIIEFCGKRKWALITGSTGCLFSWSF